MTPSIERLKELYARATKGPWIKEKAGYGWDIRGNDVWLATVLDNHRDAGEPHNEGFPTDETCDENVELIVALRNAFPALLAHIEGLEKKVARMERERKEDMRDAAAEQKWKDKQGDEYGSY